MAKPQTLSPLARLLRREQEAETSTASTPAPSVFAAPSEIVAPPKSVAPPKKTPQPLRFEGAAKTEPPSITVAPSETVAPFNTPHTRVVNAIFDQIMPTLPPSSQVILWRLYRLSIGFGSNRCRVSIAKLSQSTGVKATQLREHLRVLESRKIIKRLSIDVSNPNQHERGIEFEINLPRINSSREAAPSVSVAPSEIEPNKETHIKETHTNTDALTDAREKDIVGVRVASRFALAECRRYAESLRQEGITNPGGYATKIHRSGEADDLISAFLTPVESAKKIDVSGCPDCRGTGFYEPGEAGKGVARCKHERLKV